jgi:hypothetical protein
MPSHTPDDEAALLAHEHEADDPHPGYEPDDPRDTGVADQGAVRLAREWWAASVRNTRARQAARRERELDE